MTARIWLAATGCEIDRLRGHYGPVTSVAFSPDGARLATGSRDTTARIWDADTVSHQIACLYGHEDVVASVVFSPDGARLATGSRDGTARIWDADTGREIARFDGHAGSVASVAFSPDGTRLATGSYDGTARIWPLFGEVHTFLDEVRSGLPRELSEAQRARFHLPPAR